MKSISLENFRSFEEIRNFELKPITILLGKNSSGKSNLLRFFPLLKQTMESRTNAPLLWYGDLVDFGNFDDVIFKFDNKKNISFGFNFSITKLPRFYSFIDSDFKIPCENEETIISAEISIRKSKEELQFINKMTLKINDIKYLLSINNKGTVLSLYINDVNLSQYKKVIKKIIPSGLIPAIFMDYKKEVIDEKSVRIETIDEILYKKISSQFNFETKRKDLIEDIRDSVVIGSYKDTFDSLKKLLMKKYIESDDSVDSDTTRFIEEITYLVYLKWIRSLLFIIDAYLNDFCGNIRYIKPVRAVSERFYRKQDLMINDIDPQGKNIALYINSLSPDELTEFSNWIKEIFNFSVDFDPSPGHISLEIGEGENPVKFNISDVGFGYSQLLPIITMIWEGISRKSSEVIFSMYPKDVPIIFAIEQPELHLHPALQAKLADLFIATINLAKEKKSKVNLIIETHSEALINRLGILVGENQISSNDISISIFEKNESYKKTIVAYASYNEDGYLINWPYGFFGY